MINRTIASAAKLLLAWLPLASFIPAMADTPEGDPWIHVYTNPKGDIYRTYSLPADSLTGIDYTTDGSGAATEMTVRSGDMNASTTIKLEGVANPRVEIGVQSPTMYIDIENGAEVIEKERYLKASVRLEGHGLVDDFPATEVSIKGRGNSTWVQFPKKPWRLKFGKKQQLAGLAKAKNFALLANFIDPSHMRNTVAFRIAQMLEMPWTNHSVPVSIIMNGTYRGLYMLTEKVGINSGSVDVEDTEGILWELDTNYDENYKFHSAIYGLPVMVKDPDFDELAEDDATGSTTASGLLEKWSADFNTMEAAVAGNTSADWTDLLDLQSVVNYVFVCSLTGNHEPSWPKSVYLHKATISDKYSLGPVWDFDWAYTFGGNYEEGAGNPRDLWISLSGQSGSTFFRKLCGDSRFRAEFSRLVDEWYGDEGRISELMEYIDEYSRIIAPAAYANGERWPQGCDWSHRSVGSSEDFAVQVENLKKFLSDRISFMHSHRNFGLY